MAKILFIGDLNQYGRSYQRFLTLKALGHEVVAYSHTKVSLPGRIDKPTFLYRVFWKLRLPMDDMKVNAKIIQSLRQESFDVLWIEKGNMIWPWTLWQARKMAVKTKIISCSEDDMYVSHGHSTWYRWGVHFYDLVFTTKEYNLAELKLFGAKQTVLFLDSYSEFIHHPMTLSDAERTRFSCEVSAIGAFEPERAASLLYLAENGIRVVIWGNDWGPWVGKHPNLLVKNQFLFVEEYAKAISATKVNLNFLRKVNRDEVTSRSVEIPACGGFMLSERSRRHLEFFIEGQEAEFFSSDEELLRKVRFYLENSKQREDIAQLGKARCLKSGYSMRAQLSQILNRATNEAP